MKTTMLALRRPLTVYRGVKKKRNAEQLSPGTRFTYEGVDGNSIHIRVFERREGEKTQPEEVFQIYNWNALARAACPYLWLNKPGYEMQKERREVVERVRHPGAGFLHPDRPDDARMLPMP